MAKRKVQIGTVQTPAGIDPDCEIDEHKCQFHVQPPTSVVVAFYAI